MLSGISYNERMVGKVRNKTALTLAAAAVCLALGLLIYLFFRPQAAVTKALTGFFQTAPASRRQSPAEGRILLRLVNNFLPDILWAAALTFAVVSLLGEGRNSRIAVFVLCASCEAATELMQKTGLLSGTFDPWDIALEVITTGIVLLIIIHYRKIWRET